MIAICQMFETCVAPDDCILRCEYGPENLAACDYYQGIGTCTFGCYDEPSCMTDEPRGGWPPIERPAYANFLLAARRYDHRVANWVGWQSVRRLL